MAKITIMVILLNGWTIYRDIIWQWNCGEKKKKDKSLKTFAASLAAYNYLPGEQ